MRFDNPNSQFFIGMSGILFDIELHMLVEGVRLDVEPLFADSLHPESQIINATSQRAEDGDNRIFSIEDFWVVTVLD